MKKREFNFLDYVVLIPIFSTLFFLLLSVFVYTYLNITDGNKFIKDIEDKLILNEKNILKERVNFVLSCIESKQKELNQTSVKLGYDKKEIDKLNKKLQREIIQTIDNFRFKKGGYVFIYKILNFNGGDRFAVMVANPNRKDLVGKYISDSYKDAKGYMFRKAFLRQIRDKGEAFVTYYYKKPNSNKISPKISYFKLNKQWNWVVASGVYLDDIYVSSEKRKKEIISNINRSNIIMAIIALIILIVSIFFSIMVLKAIKRRFFKYSEYIQLQKRALTSSNRVLKRRLYRDDLTNLKNRKLLLKNLEHRDFFALVILDIDDFKTINELYGSRLGNIVLLKLADILIKFKNKHKKCYGAYRLGSDEFVLLYRKRKDLKEFKKDMDILYKTISEEEIHLVENITINISVTTGVSLEQEDALSKADIALNHAKKNGKTMAIYSPEIDNRVDIDKNIKIKRELRNALSSDNVVPYFQPICNSSLDIIKYEVLMRVVTEDRVLAPMRFLPIAKKMKIYPKLSKIIIKKSFDKFKNSDKFFSINISLNDILNIETVKYIEEIIQTNPETSKRLIFEILESEGIEDFETTKKFIDRVRKMGAKIAIDDFGSGYSSFRYILEIKPDFIKIDGSLISNIIDNDENYILVKSIISMAKDLNITTVAEFVSSEEIFKTLQEVKVDEFQGYYIGKPSKEL